MLRNSRWVAALLLAWAMSITVIRAIQLAHIHSSFFRLAAGLAPLAILGAGCALGFSSKPAEGPGRGPAREPSGCLGWPRSDA
jgi:hypothetical protein